MLEKAGYYIILVLIYLLPFILLGLFNRSMNRYFKEHGLPFKYYDFFHPYLWVGFQIFTDASFEWGLLPYLLIGLSIWGIILALICYFTSFPWSIANVFKTWWRSSFVISFIAFVLAGLWYFIQLVI